MTRTVGAESSRLITREERLQLAQAWRGRADNLNAYAARARREGDTRAAEDAEQAAVEYRIEAENLELITA